jgi:putative Holliday junction resolvase
MVIVGLDVGQVRIGVAVSDESELVATPRTVIRRRSNAAAIEAIARVVRESRAGLVVVGLPVSFDGKLHAQAHAIQAFADRLRRALAAPLVYVDETLSTVRAEELLRAAGVRPDRMRERIDAAAAAVILQDYLDRPERPVDAAAPITPADTPVDGQA